MCKFAFAGHADKVVVSDIERDIGGPSHTVKTIERLIFNHPEDRFVLIVGSDTRKEMDGWKDAEKIKSMVRLITIPRGPDSHISNISSSDVRMSIKDGKSFEHLVSREIAVYIITHGLYS